MSEIRAGYSNVLFMPHYREPIALRILETAWDILRPYPECRGRERWTDDGPMNTIWSIVPLPGDGLLLTGDDGVAVVDVSGGHIDRRWSQSGFASSPVRADGQDVVLVDESTALHVMRLGDGVEVSRFVADVGEAPQWQVFMDSILIQTPGSVGTIFEGFDLLEGDRWWNFRSSGYVLPVRDGILSFEEDGGDTTITLYH